MRMSMCVRAAVTAGIALGGYMASSTITFGIVGVSSAEAAQFYTRKRINGRWVTGQFPKSGRTMRSSRTRHVASLRTGRRPVIEVPASATLAALPPEIRRDAIPQETRRAEPVSASMPTTTGTLADRKPVAGLPDVEAALVTAAVGPVPPADESGIAAEERVLKLRRALQARADELKVKSESAPASVPAALALQPTPAAASVPEATSGPLSTNSVAAAPVPSPAPLGRVKVAPLVPRSVSYDFETGIKTTVFESSVVREPFDRAAMRGLMTGSVATR
jgi:hypothetical protein